MSAADTTAETVTPNRAQRRHPDTVNAEEFADRLGVSRWALYQSIRDGNPPIEPIRVGRRIVFSRAQVDAVLGLDTEESNEDQATAAWSSLDTMTTPLPAKEEGSRAQST